MDHLKKHVVTENSSVREYNTNFAAAFYFFAFCTLVVYSLSNLKDILTPLAISILIWFLINALANNLKKIPIFNTSLGSKFTIPLSLVIIVFLMLKMGSFIALSTTELTSTISQIDDKMNALVSKLSVMVGMDLNVRLEKLLEQFSLSAIINKVIAAFGTLVSNILQILLYVLFLLIDQSFFNAKLNALFKDYDKRKRSNEVLSSISKTIRMYLSITTVVSLITGLLVYITCLIFDLEGAVLWGFIAFILNFIPTIGSIVAVVIPTLFALVSFPELADVFIFFIILAAIQFVVGNIIYPKMMGDKLNISQFIVILSLVIWGAMWGTIGMFLAVPLMMILMIILSQFKNTQALAIIISGNGKITT